MATRPYDPVARRLYYERTKKLKGRRPSAGRDVSRDVIGRVGTQPVKRMRERNQAPVTKEQMKKRAQARVVRLTEKLNRLQDALKEAHKALREQRKADKESRDRAKEEEKKSSDDKTTAKERAAAKEYRDKNKAEIARKAKKAADSSNQKKTVSEMSEAELGDRIEKINTLIKSAKEQIKKANARANSL